MNLRDHCTSIIKSNQITSPRIKKNWLPMEEDVKTLLGIKKLNSKSIKEANQKNLMTKRFSFIPYLIKVSYEMPSLKHHSALKILELLDQMFITPQHFQKEIEKIGAFLKGRDDLFQAFLVLVENKQFKDDLYYWYPDLKHTNIFSFVCDLFCDVSSLFILHVTKSLIVNNTIPWNLVELLETKLSVSALAQISTMKKDMEIFESEVGCYVPNNNLPLTKYTDFRRRIISHSYWTDSKCEPFDFFVIEQPLHNNRKYSPCSCFSMVEVEFVGGKSVTLLVTLKAFEDLLLKKENMKWYWIKLGIVDYNWNFII